MALVVDHSKLDVYLFKSTSGDHEVVSVFEAEPEKDYKAIVEDKRDEFLAKLPEDLKSKVCNYLFFLQQYS